MPEPWEDRVLLFSGAAGTSLSFDPACLKEGRRWPGQCLQGTSMPAAGPAPGLTHQCDQQTWPFWESGPHQTELGVGYWLKTSEHNNEIGNLLNFRSPTSLQLGGNSGEFTKSLNGWGKAERSH